MRLRRLWLLIFGLRLFLSDPMDLVVPSKSWGAVLITQLFDQFQSFLLNIK